MRFKVRLFSLIFVSFLVPSISLFAQENRLKAVASQSILADVAQHVAGDAIEVSALIPRGADPHSFIPSPSDLTAVAEADLVLLNGSGYEGILLEAIENAGEAVNIVVASACVEILPYGATFHRDDDEHEHDEHADEHDEHADEHDDDDEHADEHDDDEHADEHDDDEHADEHDDDEHADDHDDHADEHDDDEHADEHDDEHDEHADEHDDDEHADEHDDEHGDDDHADEHDHDDEHADEHDDEHADEHGDERTEMGMAPDCADHDAERAALVGGADDRERAAALGREKDINCGAGNDHDHGDADEHDHAEGSCDPHVWMDPHNVIYWTLMIRDTFAAMDHDNAELYAANAAAYLSELVALEAEFILPALAGLPLESRILITSHETLGYFAAVYGFKLITTIVPQSHTMVEPSARDVADVVDQVRAAGVSAIFSDTFSPDGVMSSLASEMGVDIVGLYSDTLSDSAGPAASYLEYMRYNVTAIVDALTP